MNDIAKNSGIVLALSLFATVIGYLLRLYLARNLSVAEYGLFYAVLVFVGVFASFRDMGLNVALTKFIPEFLVKKQHGRIKGAVIFVSLVQFAIGAAIVIPIFLFSNNIAAAYFGTQEAALLLRLISLSFFVSIVMTLLQTVFQGLEKMFYFAVVEPLRLSVAFAVSFLLINAGAAAPAYGYLIAPFVVSAALLILLVKSFPFFREKSKMDTPLMKSMLLFGLSIFAGSLGNMMISYADTMILTLYRSLYEVGLYQAAVPTSQLLWFFIGGIGAVLLPTFSALWAAGRKDEINNGIRILTKIMFTIITPLVIIFVVFPEAVLNILFGAAFVSASQSLQILAVGAIFYTFYSLFGLALIATGNPKTFTKLTLATGVSGVVLNLLLTPAGGIVGAAAATTASYVLGLVMAVFYVKRSVSTAIPLGGMLKSLAGGVITAAIMFSFKSFANLNTPAEMVLAAVISSVVYFAFVIRFVVNKDDLKVLSTIGIKLPKPINNWLMKLVR